MRLIAALFMTMFSTSAFALSDAEISTILDRAKVKTDLYFCFQGVSGTNPSGDKMIDKLIIKNCDKSLDEARLLNITSEEIESIARRVFEENKKSGFDKALENALNR